MCTYPLRGLVGGLLLFTGAACATDLDPTGQYKGHYLLIHADGYALDSKSNGIKSIPLRRVVQDTIITRIQEHIDAGGACGGVLRLLIFVHGGLNSHDQSFDRMKGLLKQDAAQPLGETCYYPLFINWDSDLGSSIMDDLFRLRFGRPAPIIGTMTSPVIIGARILGSVAHFPVALMHNGDNIAESINGAREQRDPGLCIAGDSVLHFPRNAISVATIPLLEGFGAPAWENMKRRAELAVASRLVDGPEVFDAFVGRRAYRNFKEVVRTSENAAVPNATLASPRNTDDSDEGAVRTLARVLRNNMAPVVKKNPEDPQTWGWVGETGKDKNITVEITLVGHSMGAFVVNHLLPVMGLYDADQAKLPPMPVKRIVYMAPAAPLNELEDFVIPYLQSNPSAKFSMFVLNRRDETREMGWASGVLFLPRGSVLSWVDTYFQPGMTIGQGTSGRMRNLNDYYSITKEPRDRSNSNCLDPPVATRALNDQYVPITITAPKVTADLGERFRLYESPARLSDSAVPREHGDFTKPNYFYEVLCKVEQGVFKDPDFCKQTPHWVKAEPRGQHGQEVP